MLFSLPNILTYMRILFIPLMIICLFIDQDSLVLRMTAFILYALSGITDFFDGWLARRMNLQSIIGKMLDPIADKLLIAMTLMVLIHTQDISGIHTIAALIILCREILVSGLREFLASTSVSLPVSFLAKCKTTLQIFALGFLVIGPAYIWVHPAIPSHMIGLLLLWASALITVYTGYDYIKSSVNYAVSCDNNQ